MKVLVVDDDPSIRSSVRDFLEDYGYDAVDADHGQTALARLADTPGIDLALVDLNMPVLDGPGFIKQAKALYPDLPLVVLSGVGVLDDAVDAIRQGAWDFVSKPITSFEILRLVIEKALEKARLIADNRRYQRHLEEIVSLRTAQLERANERVVHCLGKAAEFRDNDTGHHVVRAGEIAALIAKAMGKDEQFSRLIRLAAPMHDIGKISIPDTVLLKPGPLNGDDWELMKRHTILGCEMLTFDTDGPDKACTLSLLSVLGGQDDLINMAKRIALFHHERFDGLGYPHGIGGHDIPLEARIVAVADVYDALGSDRPYKRALPEDVCRQKILEGSGTTFDPEVVQAFERQYDAIRRLRERLQD